MTVEILALIVVVLFFLVALAAVAMWWVERAVWAKERTDLLNRLMSKNWIEYVGVERALGHEAVPPVAEPVELTQDHDRAWAL